MNDFELDIVNLDLVNTNTNVPADPKLPVRTLLEPVEGEPGEFVLKLDNTSLEHFTTCARNAEYYLVHHRELGIVKPALVFGSAIHKALEVQLAYGDHPEAVKYQNEAIMKYYMDSPPLPPDEFRTADRAILVMNRYRKRSPIEPFEVLVNEEGVPMVEVKFTMPLGTVGLNCDLHYPVGQKTFVKNIHVIWTGKIDALIRMDGHIWVMDHKTTSIVGKTYFTDFELNNAQVGYVWSARQLLQQPVRGSFMNAIVNRPETKTGTMIDFQRQQFIYSEDTLDEWYDNTMHLVADFIHHLRRGYFPMQTKWCVGKYGVCPYHDVCTLDRPQRAEMLRSTMYKDVTWNPLHE